MSEAALGAAGLRAGRQGERQMDAEQIHQDQAKEREQTRQRTRPNPAALAVCLLLVLTVAGVAGQAIMLSADTRLFLLVASGLALLIGVWRPRLWISTTGVVVVAAAGLATAYYYPETEPNHLRLAIGALIVLLLGFAALWAGGVLRRIYRGMVERGRMIDALTQIDPATGVFRSAAGRERLEAEVARAVRYQRPFSLLVGKAHDWQGEVARRGIENAQEIFAETLRTIAATLRQNDIVAAEPDYSFLVILPETIAAGGEAAAEHLQQATKGLLDSHFGLVQCPDDGTTAADLLREAQQALAFAEMANLPLVSRNALLVDNAG
jgi:GGDEF domain-containing protein